MVQRLIVYISGQSISDLERQRAAIGAYAVARGWPVNIGKMGHPTLLSDNTFEEASPGPMLDAALNAATDASVFVIPSLGDLGDRASKQEAIILGLIAKGVRVHILELGGSVEPHLLALRTAWASGKIVEKQLDELATRYDQRDAAIKAEQEQFENELVARMAEAFGVQQLTQKLNGSGSPPSLTTEPLHSDPFRELPSPTAEHVKALREQKGLSQQQLADLAGTSKSAIGRIEATGRGEKVDEVIAVLAAAPDLTVTPR